MMNNSEPLDNDPTMNETPSVYDPAPFDTPLDNDPTMTEDAMETFPEADISNDDGFSAAASATVAAASATAAAAGSYMWAALDSTGMVSPPQEEEEPKQDRIDAFDPFAMSDDEAPEAMDATNDSDDEPITSRTTPGAVAVANYDAAYDQNLKDTDSDTGDEKDSDSEARAVLVAAVPDHDAEDKKEKRMLVGAVCLVFFLAIFAGAYAGIHIDEERVEQARSTEFENIATTAETIPKCFPGSNPTRQTAFMQVAVDGMSRQATSSELQQVQNAVTGVYNGVTGGCGDVYERIMESASVVNQNLVTDSKGKNHLSIDLSTSLRCDGCTAEQEYLFSPWGSTSKGKSSTSAKGKGKGTTSTAGGERKLRRGNRHAHGVRGLQTVAPASGTVAPAFPYTPINTGGLPTTTSKGGKSGKSGKSGKGGKGGKSNTRAQMFIDSLDATLQTSNLPLKKVKAAYIYEQTAVWKGEKLKLSPTKIEKKKDGKGKGSSDKLSAKGRRRRH